MCTMNDNIKFSVLSGMHFGWFKSDINTFFYIVRRNLLHELRTNWLCLKVLAFNVEVYKIYLI